MFLQRSILVFLIAGVFSFGSGCTSSRTVLAPEEVAIEHEIVSPEIPDHPVVERLIRPYRDSLQQIVSKVIGVAAAPLPKGKPESPLGNLVADALLEEARLVVSDSVDFAVTNSGGLRIPELPAGPITIGKIYELMPFENFIVVLTLTALEVDSLAQQIAAVGGEPVAGIRFKITPAGQAIDIRVAGEPLQPTRTYQVATINYLADGGGNMPALWTPQKRINTTVLLRDAIVHYIERRARMGKPMEPIVDGRISYVKDEAELR